VFETQCNLKITNALSVCISKYNSLLLFRHMVTVCYNTLTEFINTLCGRVQHAVMLRHSVTLFRVINPRNISFSYTQVYAC
jgi:hypothetical protein